MTLSTVAHDTFVIERTYCRGSQRWRVASTTSISVSRRIGFPRIRRSSARRNTRSRDHGRGG
jgi:hypothetical protein